jgi:hypothetical protein
VQPPASSGPLSLTHVPTALFGGTTAEAYVSLITTTAQPGLVVHMSSSSPDVTVPSALKMTASVPNEAGAYVMADSFPVRTRTVSVPTCGVITVTGASSTRYALVTLIAPAG